MRRLARNELAAARHFKASVYGLPCTVCQSLRLEHEMDAHHVVERQEIRRRGFPEWDPRNAMALCRRCHERHTSAHRRVPLRLLTATHWQYAREVLGDYADDYVARRYK